jgi:hypothetical protein
MQQSIPCSSRPFLPVLVLVADHTVPTYTNHTPLSPRFQSLVRAARHFVSSATGEVYLYRYKSVERIPHEERLDWACPGPLMLLLGMGLISLVDILYHTMQLFLLLPFYSARLCWRRVR